MTTKIYQRPDITLGMRVCDLLGLDPAYVNHITIDIEAYPEVTRITVELRENNIEYLDVNDPEMEEVRT